MPEISVIVPVYEVEKYLNRCVNSILTQTFRDFELVLVDDGSTDNCGKMCDEIAANDVRVKVIHQKNGGLSAARNAGLDWIFAHSNSKWLTFVDSDDYISKWYLETLYGAVCESKSQISTACVSEFTSNEIVIGEKPGKRNYYTVSGRNACFLLYSKLPFQKELKTGGLSTVQACNKLYKRELFRNIRFPQGKLYEDQGTTYKLFYQADSVCAVDCNLYFYFYNEAGISHGAFSLKRFDDLDFLQEAINFFDNQGEEELSKAASERYDYLRIRYCFEARKAGLYRKIPKKHCMGSLIQQAHHMERLYGRNQYEYMMAQYYPRFLRVQSVIRKIVEPLLRHQ